MEGEECAVGHGLLLVLRVPGEVVEQHGQQREEEEPPKDHRVHDLKTLWKQGGGHFKHFGDNKLKCLLLMLSVNAYFLRTKTVKYYFLSFSNDRVTRELYGVFLHADSIVVRLD